LRIKPKSITRFSRRQGSFLPKDGFFRIISGTLLGSGTVAIYLGGWKIAVLLYVINLIALYLGYNQTRFFLWQRNDISLLRDDSQNNELSEE
jgi:hypothetical protein